MTSDVKYDLYVAIENALEAIPAIKHVLKYNSQDLTNDKIHQRNYPQAWVQLSSIEWQPSSLYAHNQNGTQEQKGTIEVIVYISQHSLSGDNETWKPDLTLINTVYRALTNLQLDTESFTPLQRVRETDYIDNNNVRIWQTVYTTMAIECGVTENLVDVAPVDLVINKTITT